MGRARGGVCVPPSSIGGRSGRNGLSRRRGRPTAGPAVLRQIGVAPGAGSPRRIARGGAVSPASSAAAGRSARDRGRRRSLTSASTRLSIGRMGGEQVGKALARIVDAHFHDRRGRAVELAAALDLAQRRDHGVGVLGQFDRRRHRRGIRASATARSGSRPTAARRARSAPAAITSAMTLPPLAAVAVARRERRRQPKPLLNQSRKISSAKKPIDAGDDHGDHHHAHVAVADMGELVAEHGLDLGVVERGRAGRSSP